MSSTRVKDRQGKHLDFYETPVRAIMPMLPKLTKDGIKVLEPCAGRGAIVKAIKSYCSAEITSIEIQENFKDYLDQPIIGDFLQTESSPIYDLVMTNPPFSQAEEFIKHARKFIKSDGKLAFLLRLPFIAGVKRYNLFKEFCPYEINVLSQRPKFGGSNIDSCDYAWICWNKSSSEQTSINWIEPS